MKKICSLWLVLVLGIGCTTSTFAAKKDVIVTLDGNRMVLQQDIVYDQDRMMLPVRAMGQALGAEVTYDAKSRTAVLTKKMPMLLTNEMEPLTWTVAVAMDSEYLTLMGRNQILLETRPLIVDDRAYLPLREMAKAMNLDVQWRAEGNTEYVSMTSIAMPEVQLQANGTFDFATMSLPVLWKNDENVKFYAWDSFWLEKWDGHQWNKVEQNRDYIPIPEPETYSIPTGMPSDGKKERKLTFWGWENQLTDGKYRVAVPYQYQEGNDKNVPFFTWGQIKGYASNIPTTYVAYGTFAITK